MKIEFFSKYARGTGIDISENGYQVLAEGRYKKIISSTVIDAYPNGTARFVWLDQEDRLMAEYIGDPEGIPKVGKVIREEIEVMPPEESELISVKEYAAIHFVDPATVRQKILRGNLPAEKIGNSWGIRRNEPYVNHRWKK